MYRTIVTSAAVAVAALAIVAGASAVTGRTGCMPNPYYQSPACAAAAKQAQQSNRAVASKTAPVACLYAMPTSLVQARVCGSAPYDTAPLGPAVAKGLPLSPDVRQELYDANHREFDALDPAIATAMKQANYNPPLSTSTGSSVNWGSAGIGAVAGALLLIAAVGSGAIVRRRRPLNA